MLSAERNLLQDVFDEFGEAFRHRDGPTSCSNPVAKRTLDHVLVEECDGYLEIKRKETSEVDELNQRPEELLFAIAVVWLDGLAEVS